MRTFAVFALGAICVIQVYCQRYRPEQKFGFQQSNRPEQKFGYQQYQQPNYVRDVPQVPKTTASCPEKNGRYPTRTCDGYIECKDGIPEEKTCSDGLLFNPAAGVFAFPCQYPIDVDCSGREQTQPAQATDDCPHQFGYYRLGDAQNCGQFKNCVDGKAFVFDCPEGLAFNGDTYRCDWPDQVTTCDAEAYLGFTCPQEAKNLGLGQEEYRYFRSQSDCQKYFICIEHRPRLYNCGQGKAFNELTNVCDGIENVTACAHPQLRTQQQPTQYQYRAAPSALPTYRSGYKG